VTAGVVSTFAGPANLLSPKGVAVDVTGNVYFADSSDNIIFKATPLGAVSTLAGMLSAGSANGLGSAASFSAPTSVAVDAVGNVYVADSGNNLIRMVTPAGEVSTLAGTGTAGSVNGSASTASFSTPSGVAVDAVGNVYVADDLNNLIRRVTLAGEVSTLAGTSAAGSADGSGSAATFDLPQGVAVDAAGNVYVADVGNGLIRKIASVGIGQLAVTWSAPTSEGTSAITSYTASASASGLATKTCMADALSCTLSGLVSGIAYNVSVTATNGAGDSAPSATMVATPN
jgi:serine/threonine-protein kinase